MELSPWEQALGRDIEELHPRLQAYFRAIPEGSIGYGDGVFDVIGSPRRWLWPLLAVLGLDGIVFPAWERDVRFRVRNQPGANRVDSLRRFEFSSRARTMVDSTSFGVHGLEDRLGRRGLLSARFEARVVDGMLHLTSTSSTVFGVPIPRLLSPRVALTERWDDGVGRQRVSLALDLPVVGRLYEYSGSFTYRVVAR